jgi:hypothetical protein
VSRLGEDGAREIPALEDVRKEEQGRGRQLQKCDLAVCERIKSELKAVACNGRPGVSNTECISAERIGLK